MGRKLSDDELKIKIAIEAITKEKSIRKLAQEYGKSESTIRRYKSQLMEIFGRNSLPDRVKVDCKIEESEKMMNLLSRIGAAIGQQDNSFKIFKIWKINSAFAEFCVCIATLILAFITVWMSYSTREMAKATREMAKATIALAESDKDRSPDLDVVFFIDCTFNLIDDKENRIRFKIGDFEKAERKAKFALEITNNWHSLIEGNLYFEYVFRIYDHKGKSHTTSEKKHTYFSEKKLKIAQKKTKKVENISLALEKDLLNFYIKFKENNQKKPYYDYTIVFEIEEESIKIGQKPNPKGTISYRKKSTKKNKKI